MPKTFYKTYQREIDHFIENALLEDIQDGDHSSLACLDNQKRSKAALLVKEPGIIAGVELAEIIFQKKNADFKITHHLKEGKEVTPGDIVFTVEGPQLDLLATERLVLNCMQRMSGIASLTHRLANKINHTACRLLDTRKTTPNFRYPEKWAVRIGGGINHRMGLFDMIMLKDNHIDFAGSVANALNRTHAYLKKNKLSLPVIVEVRTLEEVKECLAFDWIHRLLLDNMPPHQLREALAMIGNKIDTEASGNITAETIVNIAETGVDYVSLGALTHSAKNLDLSLKAVD